MAFEIRDNPDFSWSSSRARMFEECNLCYGLHYYGAHNGWLRQATPLAAAAYRYKVTRSTEGMLMDSVITNIYNHHYKDEIGADEFKQLVRHDLNTAFSASKNHKDDWYKKPKKFPVLTEMIRTDKLDPDLVQEVLGKMESIVENFYLTKTSEELKDTHKLIHLSRFNKFIAKRLDNLTIFVGIHLLYQRDDGKMVAVNYKTSNQQSHIDQLGSIALYLMHEYGFELDEIVLRDEFLLTGEHKEYYLDEMDIEEMYDVIEDSVSMMAEHVVDGDLVRNKSVPLEKYLRNPYHSDHSENNNCPYCQLVKLDLEEQPNGVKSYVV